MVAPSVPVIDISDLITPGRDVRTVAAQMANACRDFGFFYIVNHGVETDLQNRLDTQSRFFFDLDLETKMHIHMSKGGRAWRGFFPVGGELTSGEPDLKEGIYFGSELPPNHAAVKAGWPLHGQNLFPKSPVDLRSTVLEYMNVMTQLGHILMRGIAMSLGLENDYFERHFTTDPLILFRIFHYPPVSAVEKNTGWGVGEHTDYGVLTILKQDDCGGLQIKTKSGWIDAPPIENTFVCNIGDMLDKMTNGLYTSTPHRVKNVSGRSRLSFPFFFDPHFEARVAPLPISVAKGSAIQGRRWDGANLNEFTGTYGEYLLSKVSKVFPDLGAQVLK